tara:strand:+ start:853 stop:1203 length:351 start_codon:yes stop_codon:yes gene_type:complete
VSKKNKGDDVMWSPPLADPYMYGDLDCGLSSGGISTEIGPIVEISFHPKWVSKMNNISIGDIVTDEDGRVGLVMREEISKPGIIKISSVKKYLISFSGHEEVCYSFGLSRVEDVNE